MGRIEDWRREIRRHNHLILISLLLLIIAIFFDIIAGTYVTRVGGAVAADLILDNIPTVDLHALFVWGGIITVAVLFLYPLFFRVKELQTQGHLMGFLNE